MLVYFCVLLNTSGMNIQDQQNLGRISFKSVFDSKTLLGLMHESLSSIRVFFIKTNFAFITG